MTTAPSGRRRSRIIPSITLCGAKYAASCACGQRSPFWQPTLDVKKTHGRPFLARATVRVPFPAATNVANITISESGTTVFQGGAFVNGATGVLGASVGVNDLPVGVVTVDIEVASVRHLTNIVAALRAAPVINSVERARG